MPVRSELTQLPWPVWGPAHRRLRTRPSPYSAWAGYLELLLPHRLREPFAAAFEHQTGVWEVRVTELTGPRAYIARRPSRTQPATYRKLMEVLCGPS